MATLGLPDQVLDVIMKQKEVTGVELEWTISGGMKGIEVKLIWKPKRGPSKENGYGRKYKSPGNMRRDYFRMKQMLTELNSVAVGTEDLDGMGISMNSARGNMELDKHNGNVECTISTPHPDHLVESDVTISPIKRATDIMNDEIRDTCDVIIAKNDSVSETENIRENCSVSDICYMNSPEVCDNLELSDSLTEDSELEISVISETSCTSKHTKTCHSNVEYCKHDDVVSEQHQSADSDVETLPEDLTECNNSGCTYGYRRGGTDPLYMCLKCDYCVCSTCKNAGAHKRHAKYLELRSDR